MERGVRQICVFKNPPNPRRGKERPVKNWIQYKIPNFPSKIRKFTTVCFDNVANSYIRSQMAKTVRAKRYDMIMVSYATWGKVMADVLPYRPYLILDTHDFITAQYTQHLKKPSEIGKMFRQEIEVLRAFDEIWTFSIEEKYIFEQFTEARVVYIPVSFPQKPLLPPKASYKYDVAYVASAPPPQRPEREMAAGGSSAQL